MSDNDLSADGAAAPAWKERKNVLLAGAVGAAVLLLAGYFLLFSGSGEESFEPIPSAASAGAAKPGAASSASPSAAPTGAQTVLAVYDEDVYGNPFKQLYPSKPTAAASSAAAVDTTNVDVTDTDTQPEPVVEDIPSEVPDPDSEPVTETASVKLANVVDEDTVQVYINGSRTLTTYDVGTEFGGYFTLVSTRVDEDEATFNFGDAKTPFTLVEGQTRKFVLS